VAGRALRRSALPRLRVAFFFVQRRVRAYHAYVTLLRWKEDAMIFSGTPPRNVLSICFFFFFSRRCVYSVHGRYAFGYFRQSFMARYQSSGTVKMVPSGHFSPRLMRLREQAPYTYLPCLYTRYGPRPAYARPSENACFENKRQRVREAGASRQVCALRDVDGEIFACNSAAGREARRRHGVRRAEGGGAEI